MYPTMSTFEVLLFAFGTSAIGVISWNFSIKAGRYHGIYRFFAFESLLILLLLNWRYWFDEPFSLAQCVSWVFLFGSILPAYEGYRLLSKLGRSDTQFENTTVLVTIGIYKYIRHPLYASLALLGIGMLFKHISTFSIIAALVDLAAVYATAHREESEMIARFGRQYEDYMNKSKMFIPYIL